MLFINTQASRVKTQSRKLLTLALPVLGCHVHISQSLEKGFIAIAATIRIHVFKDQKNKKIKLFTKLYLHTGIGTGGAGNWSAGHV